MGGEEVAPGVVGEGSLVTHRVRGCDGGVWCGDLNVVDGYVDMIDLMAVEALERPFTIEGIVTWNLNQLGHHNFFHTTGNPKKPFPPIPIRSS